MTTAALIAEKVALQLIPHELETHQHNGGDECEF
jgi:hypothetical protein